MYVVSFTRRGMAWNAAVIRKQWSEEMLSYEAECIKRKHFAFLFNAKRWAKKELLNNMEERKELEYING